jgi:hypothetical protein
MVFRWIPGNQREDQQAGRRKEVRHSLLLPVDTPVCCFDERVELSWSGSPSNVERIGVKVKLSLV